jgi:hypothetical protein
MSAPEIALVAFACLFGGALLGMWLRSRLPEHHLGDDSQKLLGMGLGIIGTMAGLVLGLLVASATGAYNAQRNELLDVSSKVVLLDKILAHYGPEANAPRRALRVAVARTLTRIWPRENDGPQLDPSAVGAEGLFDEIEALAPKTDEQRSIKNAAIALGIDVGQTRWLMYEQNGSSLSTSLLVVLIFWFTITFLGFGLFSPTNATVVVALGLCALAVSGAILVTLEMYTPFQGFVQISSMPLREALMHMGQ